MIWGHDPPRTHEKITGKRILFVRFVFLGRQYIFLFPVTPGKRKNESRNHVRTKNKRAEKENAYDPGETGGGNVRSEVNCFGIRER